MKEIKRGGLIVIAVIVMLLVSSAAMSSAEVASYASYKMLSAEWWQWAESIPPASNPMLDTTGANCAVGQRGSTWFLAGVFNGGTVTRSCDIPENVSLYFPVANVVYFDSPDVCGQVGSVSIADMRAYNAAFISGLTNMSVELDGQPLRPHHEVSGVFEISLPEVNVWTEMCIPLGGMPGGVYSPTVDEGYYVRLNPLSAGAHTLHFHAENPGWGFLTDVTYNLTVVPVKLR